MDGLLTSWPPLLRFAIVGVLALLGFSITWRSLFRDRARNLRRCPRCWYNMTGLADSLRCPECGHLAKSESQLHRTRRKKIRALLGLIIALTLPSILLVQHAINRGWYYACLPKWQLLKELRIGEFSAQVIEVRNPNAPDWGRAVRITRHGQTLFVKNGFYFTFGGEGANAIKPIGVGEDITGDGLPCLVIRESTGGTGCNDTLFIFQLDAAEKSGGLQPFAVLNCCGRFEHVNADSIPQLIVGDRTFAYRWTSGASSPYPEVILHVVDHSYVAELDLMRKPAPPQAELLARIEYKENSQNPDRDQEWFARFASLLSVVLDLIYTGNEKLAWQFLDEHWPENPDALQKADFIQQLKSALRESPYAAEIRALNTTP